MHKEVPLSLPGFIHKYVHGIVSCGIWNPLLTLMLKEDFYQVRKACKESHSTVELHKFSMHKIPG